MEGQVTLLPSAARTATATSDAQDNPVAVGVCLALDVTATPNDAQTLTVSIQSKDSASGKYQTITAFTALVASDIGATATTQTYLYTLRPGAAETAATAKHEVQALALPPSWRAVVAHSAAGSFTYSLGASPLA